MKRDVLRVGFVGKNSSYGELSVAPSVESGTKEQRETDWAGRLEVDSRNVFISLWGVGFFCNQGKGT